MPDLAALATAFAVDPHRILLAFVFAGATIGLMFLGTGMVLRTLSPSFGRSVSNFGARIVAHCTAVMLLQAISINLFGPDIPPAILAAMAILLALLALQWAINLLFGSSVGNRVIADLLSSILHGLAYVISKPFKILQETFRKF